MKGSFRHPAERVKHTDQNVTHDSMAKYLRNDLLYRAVKKTGFPDASTAKKTVKDGVTVPLKTFVDGMIQNVTMGTFWSTVSTQQSFLHRNVRVARVEIMDLMCDELGLPHTPADRCKSSFFCSSPCKDM